MRPSDNSARAMPDVASEPARDAAALDWVGMDEVALPVLLEGAAARIVARVDAAVDLRRAEARGIHMSRLYLHVDRMLAAEPLSPCSLRRLLREFLESHAELSQRARVRIRFEHLLRRPALASGHSGWRAYPVEIVATMQRGEFALELALELAYSSTCPCSAALARALIQERFAHDFPADAPLAHADVHAWLGSERGICATPHAQRSTAQVRVRLASTFSGLPIEELVERIEDALQTPVQTAVKREDEQAFALRNGANLMFCEDGARRVQSALARDERVVDFRVRVAHHESLHAHDAVAVATKGVAGGYSG